MISTRVGVIASVVGAVGAIWAITRKSSSVPPSTVVLQPNTAASGGGQGDQTSLPITNVFYPDGANGTSPYVYGNVPPLPDFSSELMNALNPGGGCCCDENGGALPSPNTSFTYSDGTQPLASGPSQQLQNIQNSPYGQSSSERLMSQVTAIPPTPINQSVGWWPDAATVPMGA